MRKEQQMVADFTADRPIMLANNSDLSKMAELLQSEVLEALEVLEDKEKLGRELADVVFIVMSLANMKSIDLEDEIREKTALNIVRYQAHMFQEGDYDEARRQVKANEKPIIEEFYGIDI